MTKYTINRTMCVAAYLRVSVEDSDRGESCSIAGQRELIRRYMASRGMAVDLEYVDDGWSGTDFNRPAFKKMLSDCEAGRIGCIVVKDLSRLGRNYIEAGRLLERIFPLAGIRFIAVTDHYDSVKRSGTGYDIIIPFKNLLNDACSRDLSVKIRSHLDEKRKNGLYTGALAPYGYTKDDTDKNRLIINGEAAAVVRRIFDMKINGLGNQAIADRLNAEGIPSPGEYRKMKSAKSDSGLRPEGSAGWRRLAVERILKDEVYTGTMIQKKRAKLNFKLKKTAAVGPDEQIRVDHTHDAIVSREIFEYTRELPGRAARTPPGEENVYLLSGFIRCGDCGHQMIRRQSRYKDKIYRYFHCSLYKHSRACSPHNIRQEKVEASVLHQIRKRADQVRILCGQMEKSGSHALKRSRAEDDLEQIKKLKNLEQRYLSLQSRLSRDMADGLVTVPEYIELESLYANKLRKTEDAIAARREAASRLEDQYAKCLRWMESARHYSDLETLTRGALAMMARCVEIYENGGIKVRFRFEEELGCMEHLIRKA